MVSAMLATTALAITLLNCPAALQDPVQDEEHVHPEPEVPASQVPS